MSTTKILSSIDEYIEIKKQGKDDKEVRKKFAQTLNEYIDFRIKTVTKNMTAQNIAELIIKAPKPPDDSDDVFEFVKEYIKWHSDLCIILNKNIDE